MHDAVLFRIKVERDSTDLTRREPEDRKKNGHYSGRCAGMGLQRRDTENAEKAQRRHWRVGAWVAA
jgi:hypothetical protein